MLGGLAVFSSTLTSSTLTSSTRTSDPLIEQDATATPRPLLGISMSLPQLPIFGPQAPSEASPVQGQVLGIFDEAANDARADEPILAVTTTVAPAPAVESAAVIVDALHEPTWAPMPELALKAEPTSDLGAPRLPKEPSTIVVVADSIRSEKVIEAEPEGIDDAEPYLTDPALALNIDDDDESQVIAIAGPPSVVVLESAVAIPQGAVTQPPSRATSSSASTRPSASASSRPSAFQLNANPVLGSGLPSRTGLTAQPGVVRPQETTADTQDHPATVLAASAFGP
jgi:hypothetical protein